MTRRRWGPGLQALRHRDFALYAGASFLSTIALQIQATALAWQIYEITGDPLQLGLVGLAEFLPGMLLALPAGHLADRLDRRLVMVIGVSAEMVAAIALLGLAAVDVAANLVLSLNQGLLALAQAGVIHNCNVFAGVFRYQLAKMFDNPEVILIHVDLPLH